MWHTVIMQYDVCILLFSIHFKINFVRHCVYIINKKQTQTQLSLQMISKAMLWWNSSSLFAVLLAVNDRFWSITFLHKWNTLKQRVVPVKAMWFQTPTTDTQVLLEPFSLTDLRDCLAPNTVFVSEMAVISGWSQAEGLFWTCEGANRARKECMGRKETWASRRGLEWEAEKGRARRSGIIRSLCCLLKRLRRKPADGPSAPRHLGKGDTHTQIHTHTLTLLNTWVMQKRKQINKWEWTQVYLKQRKMTNRKNKTKGWLSLFLIVTLP